MADLCLFSDNCLINLWLWPYIVSICFRNLQLRGNLVTNHGANRETIFCIQTKYGKYIIKVDPGCSTNDSTQRQNPRSNNKQSLVVILGRWGFTPGVMVRDAVEIHIIYWMVSIKILVGFFDIAAGISQWTISAPSRCGHVYEHVWPTRWPSCCNCTLPGSQHKLYRA